MLFIGSVFAYIYKDGTTLISTFAAVSAVLITKTYVQGKTDQKVMDCNKITDGEDVG